MNESEGGSAIDLRTAKVDDIRGRDLSPGMMAQASAPKPTWFVKRLGDGMIFACEEREAWDILHNTSNWKRHDFKFIGHSDGKTFLKIAKHSLGEARKLEPEIDQVKKQIAQYRAMEERIVIDQVVDMDGDPKDTFNEENKQKVFRVRSILEKQEKKLEALETEYRSFTRDVVKRATDEEMRVAMKNWKKNKTWPGAMNIFTPAASPRDRARILSSMKA